MFQTQYSGYSCEQRAGDRVVVWVAMATTVAKQQGCFFCFFFAGRGGISLFELHGSWKIARKGKPCVFLGSSMNLFVFNG